MKRKELSSSPSVCYVKKKKKNTLSEKDIRDFGQAYGWALFQGATVWNYHDDSGCYHETCRPQKKTFGNWTMLYRPTKQMRECEGNYCFVVHFLYRLAPITAKLIDELIQMLQIVDGLYLQSYNDVRMLTQGKWSAPIAEGTVEEIAQIVSPLSYTRKGLKMTMELRGTRGNSVEWQMRTGDSWTPHRLACWLCIHVQEDQIDDLFWFTHPSVDAVFE